MKIFGFDISRAKAQTKNLGPTTDKLFMPELYGGNNLTTRFYTPPSAFLTAMGANSNTLQVVGDPRLKSQTYIVMAATMPEVSKMMDFHTKIMGCPEIESDDEVFADEANAMLAELQWKGQLTYAGDRENGLDKLVNVMAFNTMTLGQSFYSLLDSQGLPALMSRQKVDVVQFHDSERFMYNQWNVDEYHLQYVWRAETELNKQITEAFRSVRFDSDARYAWGRPLLYWAEQVAMTAAIKLEMQTMTYRKKAASPSFTIASIKPIMQNEAAATNEMITRQIIEQWDVKGTELRNKFSDMMRDGYQTGQGGDLVTTIIGDLNLETHSPADAVQPVFSYNSDIKLDLSRLVVAMRGVPDLVGLGGGGDGIGSNRSQIQMQSMEMYGKSLRMPMQKVCDHIFQTVAIRIGKRIPKYTWKWEGLSMNDLQAQATLEQTQATTQKTWTDALNILLAAGEVTAAKAFAVENDLDWFAIENGTL
jgi:hypothetical protein